MYISTEGVNSAGILAQSIGGGGGAGGITFKGGLSVTSMSYLPSLSFNSGGGGGTGGSAGAVSVTGVSSIQTLGESSPGILAQSVGGGGGSGGISIGVSAEGSISIIEGLNVTMGGNGGSGGDADSVTVTSGGGFITTAGNSSSGIVAQSVGGGGGSGGGSISASIGVGAAILPPLTASIGGKGGTGGKAAAVTVANSGSITTGAVNTGTGLFLTGNDSYGILAQSVGGGGGNAGFSISARADLGGIIGGTSLSFGGEGGTGNTAGDVQVTSTGSLIRTLGDRSTGILAQSIGGGGGNGGFSIAGGVTNGVELSVSAGGNGGSGGDAGVVRVTNTGSISTGYIDPDSAVHGHDSAGIQAQSIGGGGGSGGFSVSAAVATSDASISIGGSGGGTGNGGNVTINNTGDAITTLGDRSTGILAQSIGGGGGSGGFSVGGQLTLVGAGIGMSFGCAGGGGGNGGSVTINDSGRLIVTSGDRSTGILAQSIGGGGGTGGLSAAQGIGSAGAISLSLGSGDASGGNGGSVSVTTASGIVTSGDDSAGILAQSVGSGGGFGGIDVSGDLAGASSMTAALGASGTGNGDGGDLSLISTGSAITTSGDRSHGILAQSIGGGGGAASIGVTGSVEATSAAVTLGGQNGGSGTGGTVSVQNASGIEAAGAGSYGIIAQSIGGGGGLVSNAGTSGIGGLGLTMPDGDGTNTGDGGQVTITNSGGIATSGAGAIAIIAQSIGGGGGLDAVNGNAGSAGGTGTGGPVTVNNSGNIVTQGSYAHAIIAQSIGGTGTGGPVTVTNGGNILAEGAGSDAILAQSTGGSGGNISVTIQDGIVRGGSGTGSAVRILEGAVNTLTNYGTLVSKGGPLGNALIATTGDETINNFGTIAGSVDLGTGNSTFNNMTGSWFLPGTTVNLGGTGTLTNKGTLSPGGLENVVTTTVTGNYVQQSSGVYAVDIDTRAGTADHVKVSGATALAGWVAPNIANKGFALPGTQQVTIVTGNTGITNNGLKVIQASAAAQYELVYPNATDVALRTSIDFAPAGLTGNQAVIGNNINSILLAGGSASLAPVVARLLYLPSVQALGEAFDRLSPAPFMAMSTAATHSNIRFADEMLSCNPRDGDHRFTRQVRCVWTRVSGSETHLRGDSDNLGYDRNAYTISAGIQQQIAGDFFGGFALSYENSTTDVSSYSRSTGSQIQGGLVAKNRWGGTAMALGVTGGYGWYDTKRYVDLPYPGTTAKSKQGITSFSGRARLAHDFEWKKWYLRPILDGTISYASMGGFTESGAAGANLSVEGRSQTTISARPALEAGGELSFKNGILARPYARAGLLHIFSGTRTNVSAQFEGAPANVPSFTIRNKLDSDMAYVSAGVDLFSKGGMVLRLDYSGLFSGNLTSGTGSFKLSIPF